MVQIFEAFNPTGRFKKSSSREYPVADYIPGLTERKIVNSSLLDMLSLYKDSSTLLLDLDISNIYTPTKVRALQFIFDNGYGTLFYLTVLATNILIQQFLIFAKM